MLAGLSGWFGVRWLHEKAREKERSELLQRMQKAETDHGALKETVDEIRTDVKTVQAEINDVLASVSTGREILGQHLRTEVDRVRTRMEEQHVETARDLARLQGRMEERNSK